VSPPPLPSLQDIEAVDPEYYKNLKWMLENDITDVLDLTFTAESDFFGKTEVVELVPGGREAKVTEANKREYVNLIARHRMTTSIKAQIQVGTRVCGGAGDMGGGVGVLWENVVVVCSTETPAH
jgi:hypothetical protein